MSQANNQRRRLLALAAASIAGAAPRFSLAADKKRVGIIGVAGGGVYSAWKKEFPKEFASLGWTDGKNLELVWFDVGTEPSNDGRTTDDLRELGLRRAREMAAAGLDCLVANGEPHARMLFEATRTVPIVVDVPDPVANGFVKSLAHPGGNMTGLHAGQEEIALKTVELLRRMVPSTTCMAWAGLANFARSAASYENAAKAMGLQYRAILIKGATPADTAHLRDEMLALRRHGCLTAMILPLSDGMMAAATDVALAQRLALASYQFRRTGLLVRYGSRRTSEEENSRRIPLMVARILRGEKPGDIPWEGPNRYELAINLKTAEKIGIAVPVDVLTLADEVVR